MSDSVQLLTRPETVLIPSGPNKSGDQRRRNWVPLKNEPGTFRMIPKSSLGVDNIYQRKVNDRLIRRIMGNWSWVACGVIEVSTRDGGVTWFIVDGQHRWEAAKHISSINKLPCLCFELDNVRDEAIGFLAANSERRLPSLADQFKALLVTGDPNAVVAHKLAGQFSREIKAPASPTTVSCVSDFMRCLQANRAAMERVFPIMAEVCQGRIMPGRLFRAMHGLERRVTNGSLSDPRWRKRIVDIGLDDILDSIRAITLIEHNAGDRACAQGLLRAINKRVPLRGQLLANMDIVRR
jgi:hypothetical protein